MQLHIPANRDTDCFLRSELLCIVAGGAGRITCINIILDLLSHSFMESLIMELLNALFPGLVCSQT